MKFARQRDKRWSARRPFRRNIVLSGRGNVIAGVAHNISMGGLRVDIDTTALVPSSAVCVRFPGLGSVAHGFRANVIWTEGGRTGLEFSDHNPDALRLLRELIRR